MELREKIVTIILLAQKPIYITGFNIIPCRVESFKKVSGNLKCNFLDNAITFFLSFFLSKLMRSSFSYIMMIYNLDHSASGMQF